MGNVYSWLTKDLFFNNKTAWCEFIWSVTNIFQSKKHELIRYAEVKVLKIIYLDLLFVWCFDFKCVMLLEKSVSF